MEETLSRLDFSNTEQAFSAKSLRQLRRDYWLFAAINNPFLTRWGSLAMAKSLAWGLPVQGIIRKTLFQLFVGGESLANTLATTDSLYQHKIYTALDYSVEHAKTEHGFDATRDHLIETLQHGQTTDAVAFSALKVTGLGSLGLMAKIQAGESLSEEEQTAFERMQQRLEAVAVAAETYQTPVFIDAEESWGQDVIDSLAESLMERYNQQQPLIWTTVQLYRHDRLAYLQQLIQRSRERGYILGVKLVRGAYLEKENTRAAEMGYPTPMQPNKHSTDRDYQAAIAHCIRNLDHVAVCTGTHNEMSCYYLSSLMQERGIPNDHPWVWVSQLYSMSDHISFNMAKAGFNIAKYLPYGPVKAVMPYLLRRAQENTSIAGQASREMELHRKELRRRRNA